MHRRRVITVLALLIVSALTFAAVGLAAESSGSVRPADGATETPATTPLFSARRIPDAITRPQATRRLTAAVSPLIDESATSTCVMISDGRGVLLEHSPDLPLNAASNQKLLTAQVALDVLGPTEARATLIAADDGPGDGTVDGDMWMIGGGDPVIDTDTYQRTLKYGTTPHTALEDVADAIVASGVDRVAGSVVGDESRYDTKRVLESWPNSYVNENLVGPLSALAVNDAKTYSATEGGSSAVPAADPPVYAATALTDLLEARGVTVDGAPRSGTAPEGLETVVEQRSLPISEIVDGMLRFSDNNTAELLVKELGVTVEDTGSTAAGLEVMTDALEEAQLPLEGAVLIDGSGLDRSNRLTCRLIDAVIRDDGPTGPLAAGMPVAAENGTLRDRFANSPAAGRARAKTGTLNSASALSGWVTTRPGDEVAFSIVMNPTGRNAGSFDRRLQERMVEAMLDHPDRVDPALLGPLPPQ